MGNIEPSHISRLTRYRPVVIWTTDPKRVHVAQLWQALYHVPQVRDRISRYRSSHPPEGNAKADPLSSTTGIPWSTNHSIHSLILWFRRARIVRARIVWAHRTIRSRNGHGQVFDGTTPTPTPGRYFALQGRREYVFRAFYFPCFDKDFPQERTRNFLSKWKSALMTGLRREIQTGRGKHRNHLQSSVLPRTQRCTFTGCFTHVSTVRRRRNG